MEIEIVVPPKKANTFWPYLEETQEDKILLYTRMPHHKHHRDHKSKFWAKGAWRRFFEFLHSYHLFYLVLDTVGYTPSPCPIKVIRCFLNRSWRLIGRGWLEKLQRGQFESRSSVVQSDRAMVSLEKSPLNMAVNGRNFGGHEGKTWSFSFSDVFKVWKSESAVRFMQNFARK